MDILEITHFESLKRYWRRRKYQRLNDSPNRKKLQVARLGNRKQRRGLKIRLAPKLRLKFLSPIKLLAKFHQACIDTVVGLAVNKRLGAPGEKEIPKGRAVPVVSNTRSEVVDARLVLEIYKRMVSARESAAQDLLL